MVVIDWFSNIFNLNFIGASKKNWEIEPSDLIVFKSYKMIILRFNESYFASNEIEYIN